MQPKVYTIPAHRPFLATLAAGLLGMAGGDPLQLTRITVLLPTRRAVRRCARHSCKSLRAENRPGAEPLLLPRMRPIGDLDSDELSLVRRAARTDLAVPPADPRAAPASAADPARAAIGASGAVRSRSYPDKPPRSRPA